MSDGLPKELEAATTAKQAAEKLIELIGHVALGCVPYIGQVTETMTAYGDARAREALEQAAGLAAENERLKEDGWIKLADQKPPHEEVVLLWFADTTIGLYSLKHGQSDESGWEAEMWRSNAGSFVMFRRQPTHWKAVKGPSA